MTLDLTHYLENIRSDARLETADETVIMSELEAHIEDKLKELTETGMPREEAVKECLNQMGSIKSIAREIYEAYSQGSWKQVMLASMPHLIFGLLFGLNAWRHPAWLSLAIVAVLGITAYGWRHGKPSWVYTWMGYTLVPIVIAGIMLLYLPPAWAFLALIAYIPLTVWWLIRVVMLTVKRDWLFSSLMLLPLPIVIGWYLAVSPSGKLSEETLQQLYSFAPWIGLSFMGLAATIAVFVRIRQRRLRVGVLAASGLVTLSLIVYHSTGYVDNYAFVGLLFALWSVLLIPPFLERRFKKISG
jgi:hypothetical protein